ncbi:MAG: NAD(P)-binding domain-containing protein, partial [Kofleriaceae bacterium]|nr:NAD(P)-binding domain-containing protein [Kofleriaceae bacterium]
MIAVWQELAQKVDLQIRMHETVQIIHKQQDGTFLTNTTAAQYRSQRVILATGTRGKPRTLGVPGEHYPKIESLLEDPDHFRGKMVCVIGGGDSALEAALALAEAEARVILSYRGRSFHRAQAKNRQSIDKMAQRGRMKVKLQSEVVDFGEDTVTLQMSDGTQKRYPNQAAFVLIGADPPIQWLSTLGIHYAERPHMAAMPASDQLVRMFAPQAQECPTNAQDAASLIFGQQVAPSAQPQQRQQKDARSKSSVSMAGRKFIKSASSLFGIGNDKRPIPLSEFAQRGQSERAEPRDQLDASERTRILRMLRDEGGRHADEESQLYDVSGFQERAEQEQQEQRWESPTAASTPKEALIVGLAKVSREAPRGRQMRPVVEPHHETPQYETPQYQAPQHETPPHQTPQYEVPQQQYEAPQQQYEASHYQDPYEEEEKTAHLSPEEAQHLLNSSVHIPEAPSRILGGEEATQFAEFSPHQPAQPAQPTPAQPHGLYEEDEATLLADVSSLLKEGFTPEPKRVTYREPAPRSASDRDQPRSLSQVDWDLD